MSENLKENEVSLTQSNNLSFEEQFQNSSKNNNHISNKKIVIPKNTALPLISFVDNKFIIPDEARHLLSSQKYDNIGIISLVGKYRTGKSFLLNRVLLERKQINGFGVGPTFKPCTKGIWIWSEPLMITNSHSKTPFPVFLIDTEGLGAYDEEINHDTKIFLISILISSLFIYNSFGAIDENAINALSFILNLSKTIKIKSVNKVDSEEELAEYFPSLLWLLRDFSLKLEDINGNTITEKQYLENALMKLKGNSEIIEEKNRVRELIKNYFKEKDLFVMVRPVEEESDLQNLQNLPDNRLRKEFLEQAKLFRNKVMKKIKPKIFRKKNLNGFLLIQLIQSVLDSINNGSIPIIENSWKYVMQNECIKTGDLIIKKFVKEINEWRLKEKDKKNFFFEIKKYLKQKENICINEFMQNNIIDEDTKKNYVINIQQKIKVEIEKFEKENEKILEEKFTKELNILYNNFMSNMLNNEKYNKNNFLFYQDFETLRETAEKICPSFPEKENILFDKLIIIIHKFIDDQMIKMKLINEKHIMQLKLENEKNLQKISELNNLMNKNGEYLTKINNENIGIKLKYKNLEQEMNKLLSAKKNDNVNYQKNMDKIKSEYENKIKELNNKIQNIENELKNKSEEMLINQMNNEKIISLNEQKIIFLDKEMNSLKEKNNNLIKQGKSKEESLNEEIIKLNEKIRNILNEKENKDTINNDEVNNNINNLMKYFKENLKIQSEENKNLFEKIIQKEKNQTDQEIYKKYQEITQKNGELMIELNKKEQKIKNLEIEIKENKTILLHISGLKCKYCSDIFSYDDFKTHYNDCQINGSNNKLLKNNNINNTTNIKIKILKGNIKQDELGKTYLEYILEVNYNNIHNWRINKKYSQFASLYKSINNVFKGNIQMPLSSNIFINLNEKYKRGYHKNKIKQLELFLKDLCENEILNKCKPFKKFLEFDKNVDDDNYNNDTMSKYNN